MVPIFTDPHSLFLFNPQPTDASWPTLRQRPSLVDAMTETTRKCGRIIKRVASIGAVFWTFFVAITILITRNFALAGCISIMVLYLYIREVGEAVGQAALSPDVPPWSRRALCVYSHVTYYMTTVYLTLYVFWISKRDDWADILILVAVAHLFCSGIAILFFGGIVLFHRDERKWMRKIFPFLCQVYFSTAKGMLLRYADVVLGEVGRWGLVRYEPMVRRGEGTTAGEKPLGARTAGETVSGDEKV